jgi:hypothetical protein
MTQPLIFTDLQRKHAPVPGRVLQALTDDVGEAMLRRPGVGRGGSDPRDEFAKLVADVDARGLGPFLQSPIENYRGAAKRAREMSTQEAVGLLSRLRVEIPGAERRKKLASTSEALNPIRDLAEFVSNQPPAIRAARRRLAKALREVTRAPAVHEDWRTDATGGKAPNVVWTRDSGVHTLRGGSEELAVVHPKDGGWIATVLVGPSSGRARKWSNAMNARAWVLQQLGINHAVPDAGSFHRAMSLMGTGGMDFREAKLSEASGESPSVWVVTDLTSSEEKKVKRFAAAHGGKWSGGNEDGDLLTFRDTATSTAFLLDLARADLSHAADYIMSEAPMDENESHPDPAAWVRAWWKRAAPTIRETVGFEINRGPHDPLIAFSRGVNVSGLVAGYAADFPKLETSVDLAPYIAEVLRLRFQLPLDGGSIPAKLVAEGGTPVLSWGSAAYRTAGALFYEFRVVPAGPFKPAAASPKWTTDPLGRRKLSEAVTYDSFPDWKAVLAHVRDGQPLYRMEPYAQVPTHFRSRVVAGGPKIELMPTEHGKPAKPATVGPADLKQMRKVGPQAP